MDAAQFDYHLPESAIAQVPADRREHSRLLLIDRTSGLVADHRFDELPFLLEQRYAFFRNTVTVLKARLYGQRQGGGAVECLLVEPDPADPNATWFCLLKPGRKLPVGATFSLANGQASATVLAKADDGTAKLAFHLGPFPTVTDLANATGTIPLPPYIHRNPNDASLADLDAERYQTVYANPQQPFAVAAPTAGLHFTPAIIHTLQQRGHSFNDLVLHVGIGTFKPIQADRIEEHAMHAEFYQIPAPTLAALANPLPNLVVGTTSLRAIEDCHRTQPSAIAPNPAADFSRFADIFIYPPAHFFSNALLTNFHLPRSTLLCLVSAFLTPGSTDGIHWLKQIYQAALDRNYRFYSYGDAMLIL